ncbi:MAG: DUF4234 domain-containing protein [Dorea sp.]
MKYCAKCGTPYEDTSNFCTECGAPLTHNTQIPNTNTTSDASVSGTNTVSDSYTYEPKEEKTEQKTEENSYSYNYSYNADNNHATTPNYNGNGNNIGANFGITSRSIPVAIILSIVTCGIYGIYWMIKLNDEVNLLSGEVDGTSGGMVFLFSLITCGIYSIYWMFKMGERCDRIKGVDGNSHILYLVLSIFRLDIIAYCLIQDTINKSL